VEDLSRELEDEIEKKANSAQTKHKNEKKLFFIDEFGTIQSAQWIRKIVVAMGIISLVSIISAYWFYRSYSAINKDNKVLVETLSHEKKRIDSLVEEKEILLARLVLSGLMPEGQAVGKETESSTPAVPGPAREAENNTSLDTEPLQKASVPDQRETVYALEEAADTGEETLHESQNERFEKIDTKITIEDFKVSKDRGSADIQVRFDIRNISSSVKNLSGHVFVILKPDEEVESDWLVTPSVSIENGIPAIPSQGQFFSISHFKPMRFRIKSQEEPDTFKHAVVVVFDGNDSEIILMKEISLQETLR